MAAPVRTVPTPPTASAMVLVQHPDGRWTLSQEFKLQVNSAMFRIKQKFPQAIGDQLADDLYEWTQWGFRFGGFTRVLGILDEVKEYKP